MLVVNLDGLQVRGEWGDRTVRDGQPYQGRPMTPRRNPVDTCEKSKLLLFLWLDKSGHSQAEIAEIMNVSQPTASRWIARAYEKLGPLRDPATIDAD